MPKPVTLPTWSTDINFPAGTAPEAGTATKVAPSSPKLATGFRPAEKPPAQNLNWMLNALCLWAAYVESNKIDGNFEIAGALTVTGTATIAGALAADTLDLETGATIGAVGGTEKVTILAGVESPKVCWTTAVVRMRSAGEFWSAGSVHTHGHNQVIMTNNVQPIYMPLRVDIGDVIGQWQLRVQKNTDGTNEIRAKIVSFTDSGAEVDESTGTVPEVISTVTTGSQFMSHVETNAIVIASNKQYFLRVWTSGFNVPANDRIFQLQLHVTRPYA